MEQTSEETTTPSADIEAAPERRRASRRVSAAAGEVVTAPAAAESTEPAAAPAAAPTVTAAVQAAPSDAPQLDAEASQPDADAAAPKQRVSRARKKAESAPASDEQDAAQAEVSEKSAPAKKRSSRAEAAGAEGAPAAETQGAELDKSAESAEPGAAEPAAAEAQSGDAEAPKKRGNTRGRGRKPAAESSDSTPAAEQGDAAESGDKNADEQQGEKQENGNGARGADSQSRSSRTRQRERKRRGQNDDEPEIAEDDVLLPIAGILDVLDNYAFVRTSGYLPGTGDVYVSLGQVKKYGLRKGDSVVGAIRQPRDGDGGGRQKYNAIVKVDTVNSKPVDEQQTRPDFAELTPIHPNERLRIETEAGQQGPRVIDLFAPIGKGQRGIIVGPHESGKSTALQQIAQAVAQNQPDAHLMLVLVDERPEEVTALQRTINGEVIASTFDRPAEDHATIAELAVERAKRLVELGHDVIVLIDSLTSLARAYNLAAPASVRVPAGSLDAAAVFPVKRLLSAARNIENGGSLTIVATVSAQPDSRLDEALLGELEAVANMQLRLSADAADRRVFPAIDLARSSTRNEALLTSDAEVRVMNQLRRSLQGRDALEGLEAVLQQLGRTSSNVEFLAVTQRAQA